MTMTHKVCPDCGADLFRHCKSAVCDLVRCDNCKAYGRVDGGRWRINRRFEQLRRIADKLREDLEE